MTTHPHRSIVSRSGEWLARLHALAQRYSLYLLVFWTLLAGSLLVGRAVYARSAGYGFLVWNLFLAWVPYAASLWAEAGQLAAPGRWRRMILPGVVWLLFLPNAPYLVTDLIHLGYHRAPVPLWYDAVMVCAFAWTGCLLGVVSLRIMQARVAQYAGARVGWGFALTTIGLCGLGVYMGRVLRWNSWDVLARPDRIARTLLGAVADPLAHWPALAASAVFAAFMLGCYVAFVSARTEPAAERTGHSSS